MMPLMDMMLTMQNGEAIRELAGRFQLSQQKATEAVEALMPAFSEGLKRNAADPYGVANFFNALATGNHGAYVEQMQRAFQPDAIKDGNAILGHLFGSPEVSRAIARQAAATTGVGEAIFKQMLPILATMIMGGLYKQSTGALGGQQAGGSGNIFGDMMEQMMRQAGSAMGGQASHTPRAEPQNPFDNPFGKMLEGMFGSVAGGAGTPEPGDPFANNPLGRIFHDMMTGGAAAKEPEPDAKPGQQANPYDDLFGNMFEAGAKTRDEYQRSVETIFDQFVTNMNRAR